MRNKELIEYRPSLMFKVKNFFKRIFEKKPENNEAEIIVKVKKNNFLDEIKIVKTETINKEGDRKKFLEKIDGNVDALNMLSIERLKMLSQYYDEIIEENNKRIDRLKKSV